eukprot:gene11523-biopygen18404
MHCREPWAAWGNFAGLHPRGKDGQEAFFQGALRTRRKLRRLVIAARKPIPSETAKDAGSECDLATHMSFYDMVTHDLNSPSGRTRADALSQQLRESVFSGANDVRRKPNRSAPCAWLATPPMCGLQRPL